MPKPHRELAIGAVNKAYRDMVYGLFRTVVCGVIDADKMKVPIDPVLERFVTGMREANKAYDLAFEAIVKEWMPENPPADV